MIRVVEGANVRAAGQPQTEKRKKGTNLIDTVMGSGLMAEASVVDGRAEGRVGGNLGRVVVGGVGLAAAASPRYD